MGEVHNATLEGQPDSPSESAPESPQAALTPEQWLELASGTDGADAGSGEPGPDGAQEPTRVIKFRADGQEHTATEQEAAEALAVASSAIAPSTLARDEEPEEPPPLTR